MMGIPNATNESNNNQRQDQEQCNHSEQQQQQQQHQRRDNCNSDNVTTTDSSIKSAAASFQINNLNMNLNMNGNDENGDADEIYNEVKKSSQFNEELIDLLATLQCEVTDRRESEQSKLFTCFDDIRQNQLDTQECIRRGFDSLESAFQELIMVQAELRTAQLSNTEAIRDLTNAMSLLFKNSDKASPSASHRA